MPSVGSNILTCEAPSEKVTCLSLCSSCPFVSYNSCSVWAVIRFMSLSTWCSASFRLFILVFTGDHTGNLSMLLANPCLSTNASSASLRSSFDCWNISLAVVMYASTSGRFVGIDVDVGNGASTSMGRHFAMSCIIVGLCRPVANAAVLKASSILVPRSPPVTVSSCTAESSVAVPPCTTRSGRLEWSASSSFDSVSVAMAANAKCLWFGLLCRFANTILAF